jgi:hypothetical protein
MAKGLSENSLKNSRKIGLFSSKLPLKTKIEIDNKRDLMESWHWRVNTRRLIESGFKYEPDDAMKKAGLNNLDDIVKMSAKSAFERGDISSIIDDDYVFKGKPFRDLDSEEFAEATSIIIERHFDLNWLCGYAPRNNWDETPTDT